MKVFIVLISFCTLKLIKNHVFDNPKPWMLKFPPQTQLGSNNGPHRPARPANIPPPNEPEYCLEKGEPCSIGEDDTCCGHCRPDILKCHGYCLDLEESCNGNGPSCCDGYCEDNKCKECKAERLSCTVDAECCLGRCKTSRNRRRKYCERRLYLEEHCADQPNRTDACLVGECSPFRYQCTCDTGRPGHSFCRKHSDCCSGICRISHRSCEPCILDGRMGSYVRGCCNSILSNDTCSECLGSGKRCESHKDCCSGSCNKQMNRCNQRITPIENCS